MQDNHFYHFLQRQIPLLITLSLLPGLGYLLLGWLNDLLLPAALWYGMNLLASLWGWRLYRKTLISDSAISDQDLLRRQLSSFFYVFSVLWLVIFLIYVRESASKLHYIAIFTELGAATVVATLLYPDRRLYRPIILMLMAPLTLYFVLIGEWFGYVLAIFSAVYTWILIFAARNSHQMLSRANYQANHDPLTGLYNRNSFIDNLQKRITSLQHSEQYSFLLLVDLDHFKTVNDTLGHDIGDKLLCRVGERLLDCISTRCVAARLGGDEFMVMGPVFANQDECASKARDVAERMLHTLKDIYIVDRHHLYITASIGISIINNRDTNANNFIKEADIAMYEVKAKGRDGVFMFDDEMSQRVELNLEIERLLHFALERDEITLCFQPQFDHRGIIIGVETLVRWNNPQLGSVSPAHFIPIAEQTGLIIELSDYILESAFRTLRCWLESGIVLDQFSINISMRQFTHHNFIAQVERMVGRHLGERLSRKIVFEVTESIVAEDINRVIDTMHRLKALGIRFSVDDFGTGYSSLSYLARLPIDELKIDQSFISAIGQHESEKMISTILNLASFFDLKVVAEGVDNEAQHQFLLHHQCHYFQGYLFSKPLDRYQFEQLYYQRRR